VQSASVNLYGAPAIWIRPATDAQSTGDGRAAPDRSEPFRLAAARRSAVFEAPVLIDTSAIRIGRKLLKQKERHTV
jgi:hypothetical protein